MEDILRRVSRGEMTVDEALKALKLFTLMRVEDFARIDVGRELRRTVPEIILAEGKTLEELLKTSMRAAEEVGRVMVSRLSKEEMEVLRKEAAERGLTVKVYERARIAVIGKGCGKPKRGGRVGIITGGTADIGVAEEVRVVAEEMGCEVYRAYDVGVAGLHRVFEALKSMVEADVDVLVVVAGREGALPSVVASLVDVPVIGVPASQGYGFGGGGMAALQSMLQSCPLGLAVVNVDSGVAAGVVAALIANRAAYRARVARDKVK